MNYSYTCNFMWRTQSSGVIETLKRNRAVILNIITFGTKCCISCVRNVQELCEVLPLEVLSHPRSRKQIKYTHKQIQYVYTYSEIMLNLLLCYAFG